jgi:bifunctional DNase/RNase
VRCQKCHSNAVLHITEARDRSVVEDLHLCERHGQTFLPAAATGTAAAPTGLPSHHGTDEVLMDIVRVVISEKHEKQVVVLQEVEGDRIFTLRCGIPEAASLDLRLKRFDAPRPLTHDAWVDTIAACGGEVQDVLIHDFRDHFFYAQLRIRQGGRLVTVDVRPSDSFAIAVTCNAPIFVTESVLALVAGPPSTPPR